MSTYLVTGGAGYIGSHVCKALAAQGHLPVVYDNLSRGHRWAVRWGPLEVGDILDAEKLSAALERWRPVGVLHFAGLAYVGESIANPAYYYKTNVVGTLTLLDAMRKHKVDRIVFSSTCATYGVPVRQPILEDDPQSPINPYGASKLAVERILRDYGSAYGLSSIILRYFNAAGADPEGDLGECHDPEPHAIPRIIQAALGEGPAFEIFGADYDTPDGSAVRDYVHVVDLAAAHAAAMERLEAGSGVEAFNLGTGTGTSVFELVDAVERIAQFPVPILLGPRRIGDPPCLMADFRRAQRVLGWKPMCSDLDTIIRTAWAWRRNSISRSFIVDVQQSHNSMMIKSNDR